MAKSQKGILFQQIKETPFGEIPWDVFLEYADSMRGLKTFEKLIRRENDKLPIDYPQDPHNMWNYGPDSCRNSLEGLMMVIGRMKTDESFEVLREFAEGEYHPYVNVEAVWGLTWTQGHENELLRIARKLLLSPRRKLDYYSGLQILEFRYHCWRPSEVIPLVKPFLGHDHHLFHTAAVTVLLNSKYGRALVEEYEADRKLKWLAEMQDTCE